MTLTLSTGAPKTFLTNRIRSFSLVLEPADNPRLVNLCGPMNEHLRQIEQRFGVQILNRGNYFSVSGSEGAGRATVKIIKALYDTTEDEELTSNEVHLYLQDANLHKVVEEPQREDVLVRTRHTRVKAKGAAQADYLTSMRNCDLTFGIGPAGTGKTYLAVAAGVEALEKNAVDKLVLVRPAVEAGERLGFLPGDLAQKVDPYLKPMYDALYETMGFDRVNKLIDKNMIEIAPLAYMRGRSLNKAFIILDEAQNTTTEQMKMFLTRVGFGSRTVVTGDVTQVDLPDNRESGLRHVTRVLDKVEGVNFVHFGSEDVVRHALVKRIIRAYEDHEEKS